ncbi:SPOR domain-containing protein [Emticicia sp.]|uniref:SPOR domain-containing protein n=1 Tax=Emticicia sp. TaxID=1930953 RepID=UPI003751C7C9
MKTFSKIIFCVCFTSLFFACKRSITPVKNTTNAMGDYDEDLSAVRVQYDTKPTTEISDKKVIKEKSTSSGMTKLPKQVNNEVDIALDSISVHNKTVRYSSGYRIQVFVGNDRKEVDEAKSYIYQNFPELSTYLTFSQPTYKLKAGDFTSRLDAERYYSSIRQRYSMAMIISEKIDIRKSMQMK